MGEVRIGGIYCARFVGDLPAESCLKEQRDGCTCERAEALLKILETRRWGVRPLGVPETDAASSTNGDRQAWSLTPEWV